MRLIACLLMLPLAGCTAHPPVRPIVSGASGSTSVAATPAREPIPRLGCGKLTAAEQLERSVVEERMKEGSYYAALAQVRMLPENAASVALLRADILREVDAAEALRWYTALLDTCEAGHAKRGLGLLAVGRGDYREALGLLQQASDEYPTEAPIRHDLGMVQLHLGLDDDARFNLRTASELAPGDPQPKFALMLLSLLRQDMPEWRRQSVLWSPDQGQRARLAQACQRLRVIRAAQPESRLSGSARCPIDPLASS